MAYRLSPIVPTPSTARFRPSLSYLLRLVIGAGVGAVLAWSHDALAQKGAACGADIRVFCAHLQSGHGATQRCLQEHLGDLSSACRAHLQGGIERARTPRSLDRAGAGKTKQANQ